MQADSDAPTRVDRVVIPPSGSRAVGATPGCRTPTDLVERVHAAGHARAADAEATRPSRSGPRRVVDAGKGSTALALYAGKLRMTGILQVQEVKEVQDP